MILAAGLTPAWQQTLSFSQFRPGEVNRARHAAWCASGKVLNVGCALFHLGSHSKTLCLQGGTTGELIRNDFEKLGAPVRWVESRLPSRVCTTILDESTHTMTELVENPHPVTADELESFVEAFLTESRDASVIVLSGSMPPGTPTDFFRRLMELSPARFVLDIRGPELDEALKENPLVVKPNREELSKTVKRDLISEEELIAAMSELRGRGAEWVVISQGPGPLLALGPDGLLKLDPPSIQVCNPIGCGDCLAAGIAAGIDRKVSMQQALEIGVRAAAENAQALLPARNLSRLPSCPTE